MPEGRTSATFTGAGPKRPATPLRIALGPVSVPRRRGLFPSVRLRLSTQERLRLKCHGLRKTPGVEKRPGVLGEGCQEERDSSALHEYQWGYNTPRLIEGLVRECRTLDVACQG